MRISIQSATSMGVDPLWSDYENALKKNATSVAEEDTEITFSGVEIMTPALEKHYYFQLLNTPQIVENAIAAEKKGYDAFCVSCMLDPGLSEIREIINIPALFIGETSFLVSCMLGGKFSLISHNPNLLEMMKKNIERYGLEKRATSPQTLDFDLVDIAQSFKNPDKITEDLKKKAKNAVKDGAEILIPACNVLNMFCVENGIHEIEGMVVLNVLSVLIKTAEMMVQLHQKTGLTLSRQYTYCQPSPELLSTVRKSYNLP